VTTPRAFLADPRPWCFVLEITPSINDDGEIEQFLFSDHAWATKATDTPPNKRIRPFLMERGTLTRSLFDKGKFGSGVNADYGNIVLANKFPRRDDVGRLTSGRTTGYLEVR
jgi:hypothetical protein